MKLIFFLENFNFHFLVTLSEMNELLYVHYWGHSQSVQDYTERDAFKNNCQDQVQNQTLDIACVEAS